MITDKTKAFHTTTIKKLAKEYGFTDCGISKPGFLEKEAKSLENWLRSGNQGDMQYLENHFDKRLNPCLLMPGAKSVISLIFNYYPYRALLSDTNLKISRYAYGKDYHKVIKKKMKTLENAIKEHVGGFQSRIFVDSAPVMERSWAVRSGLGWIGKNGLLLTKQGSYMFVGEIITDLDCNYDFPHEDYCGSCTRCMDACPTGAIVRPYIIDARKCISYLTIEYKGELPGKYREKFRNWIFGCDICQEVCPWNRKVIPHKSPEFEPNNNLSGMKYNDWTTLTEQKFDEIFAHSPVKRTKYKGLIRNIRFITHD